MDTRWFKGATDKEQRKKEVLSYKNAFEDLTEILEQDFKKEAVRGYGADWPYKQIAVNEYNQVLRDIIKLINIKE